MESEGSIWSAYASDPDYADLVVLFVGSIPARLKELEIAFHGSDVELLLSKLHKLKGAVGSYGFHGLTQVIASFEALLCQREQDLNDVHRAFEELLALCRRMNAKGSP